MPKKHSDSNAAKPSVEQDKQFDYAITGENHHAATPNNNFMQYLHDLTNLKKDRKEWGADSGMDMIIESELSNLETAADVLKRSPLLQAKIGDDFQALAVVLGRVRN